MDNEWVVVRRASQAVFNESITDRVRRVGVDVDEIKNYYRVTVSPTRHNRLKEYLLDEQEQLFKLDFDALDQQGKADFLLLRNYLKRSLNQLKDEWKTVTRIKDLFPFATNIVEISEAREAGAAVSAEDTAKQLDAIAKLTKQSTKDVSEGKITTTKVDGYKASKLVKELSGVIDEIAGFYSTYDPQFDWWAKAPVKEVRAAFAEYIPVIEQKLAGMKPDGKDDIIGEPIGREALLGELEAEMIAYTPEELLDIANDIFRWCETQMKTAANELGFGDDWKKAREYVKVQHVAPGEQPHVVKQLALEGAEFVKKHDLLTVPRIADQTYRMVMMSPERQKQAPFFLGGELIMVAYPTSDMSHDYKNMVMKGNNKYFAKATAFHELIPGHRMQDYSVKRYNSHRLLFFSAFWMEGWALYWEFLLWNRGDFFTSPEDRIGTMFWRMHRCARIIFSLKFHLGEWTPQQCVDLLVDWVGHERSNAEAEVRRSFAGDYDPLYQAGYMLGALQIWQLRQEVLKNDIMKEKEFHDTFLRNGVMPIELVRAIFEKRTLAPDYKPNWKFYKGM